MLGLRGYSTYSGRPPIPEEVGDPAGNVVFTGEDILFTEHAWAGPRER